MTIKCTVVTGESAALNMHTTVKHYKCLSGS